jgi:hypothetical protein
MQERRAFRAAKAKALAQALPFEAWKRYGLYPNRKPVARRRLPDGSDEKWYRCDEVFRRHRRKRSGSASSHPRRRGAS